MERVGGGWSPDSVPPRPPPSRADRRQQRPSRAPGWGVWWGAASPLLSPESDAEGYPFPQSEFVSNLSLQVAQLAGSSSASQFKGLDYYTLIS